MDSYNCIKICFYSNITIGHGFCVLFLGSELETRKCKRLLVPWWVTVVVRLSSRCMTWRREDVAGVNCRACMRTRVLILMRPRGVDNQCLIASLVPPRGKTSLLRHAIKCCWLYFVFALPVHQIQKIRPKPNRLTLFYFYFYFYYPLFLLHYSWISVHMDFGCTCFALPGWSIGWVFVLQL